MKKAVTILMLLVLTWGVIQAQENSAAGYKPHS